jgi:predicted transcriptional regulator YheO
MPEPQATSISNTYYDLVSVVFHSLEGAQTYTHYIEDARQAGQQDLVEFFQSVKQTADQQAQRGRELLARYSQ